MICPLSTVLALTVLQCRAIFCFAPSVAKPRRFSVNPLISRQLGSLTPANQAYPLCIQVKQDTDTPAVYLRRFHSLHHIPIQERRFQTGSTGSF